MLLRANKPYFRITSPNFRTPDDTDWKNVVDGQGSVYSATGSRYAPKLAETVYLAEEFETCFAEKMFYFQREILRSLDNIPTLGQLPFFKRRAVLWEIEFKEDVGEILDLDEQESLATFQIFQSLILNPSQDYEHLKHRRALIQETRDYKGLRAPSSRSTTDGHMMVLFESQVENVLTIVPHDVEVRLICEDGKTFRNPNYDRLDYRAGEVRIIPNPLFTAIGSAFHTFKRLEFNH